MWLLSTCGPWRIGALGWWIERGRRVLVEFVFLLFVAPLRFVVEAAPHVREKQGHIRRRETGQPVTDPRPLVSADKEERVRGLFALRSTGLARLLRRQPGRTHGKCNA
jgi:hypothetical protein